MSAVIIKLENIQELADGRRSCARSFAVQAQTEAQAGEEWIGVWV